MAEEAAPGIDVDALVEAERTQLEEERGKHKQRQEKHHPHNNLYPPIAMGNAHLLFFFLPQILTQHRYSQG